MSRFKPFFLRSLLGGAAGMLLAVSLVRADDAQLHIDGAPADLAANLRLHLAPGNWACQWSPSEQQRLQKQHRHQFTQAAQALGYYHAQFTQSFKHDAACTRLSVQVDAGAVTHVAQLDVRLQGEAEQDSAFIDLLTRLPIQQGEQLNHAHYEQLKSELLNLLQARGYFDYVWLQKDLFIEPEKNTASVLIKLDSGPRYRIGEIRINDTPIDPQLIQSYLSFKSGDAFQSEQLIATQQALSGSQYFSEVAVNYSLDEARNYQLPVQIQLTPNKRHRYTFGVGASTDTGPRIKLGYLDRYVTESGHKFSADSSLSPVKSELVFNYTIPLQDPTREQLNLRASWEHLTTDDEDSKTYKLGVSRSISRGHAWVETQALDYQQDNFRIADVEDETHLLMPGIAWSTRFSDQPVFPQHAYRFDISLRGSIASRFSDSDFLQLQTQAKYIVGNERLRLLLRGSLGATDVASIDDLPASLRFFVGGDTSVRGYDYRSIAPRNAEGDLLGGRHFVELGIESDYRFANHWAVALFADAGDAFNDVPVDLQRSVGVGLRWLTPIAPIRFDIASPLDGDEREPRLHLSMGLEL